MLKTSFFAIAVALTGQAFAGDTAVRGYVKQNGTYVAPAMRTAPDATLTNNYTAKPNVNPYTGQAGTVNPYAVQPRPMPVYQTPVPVYQPAYRPYGK